MAIVELSQASESLPELIRRVESGEEIVIAREGRPVAHLVAPSPEPPAQPARRVGGQLRGQIWISEDFDAPLPDEIARAFGMLDE